MYEIAVIVGSIRRDSINRRLARALAKLAEARLAFRLIPIADLPLLNQDFVDDPPPEVLRFKEAVERCDAVLFVTPEHNRSVPAALKNAFDWGTRPPGRDSWSGKPAAVVGTSRGAISTALAQEAMRTMASGHVAALLGAPAVYLRYRDELFGDDDSVTDEGTRDFLQRFVDNFAELVGALVQR